MKKSLLFIGGQFLIILFFLISINMNWAVKTSVEDAPSRGKDSISAQSGNYQSLDSLNRIIDLELED